MYTLRFPFLISHNTAINNLDHPTTRQFKELIIVIDFNDPYYLITIKGFKSELQAKAFINNLNIALNWVTLNCNFGFETEPDFDEVVFPPDPYKTAEVWKNQFSIDKGEKIDCIINGNLPSVFPTNSVTGILTGRIANLTIGKNPNIVIDFLIEGLSISASTENINAKTKLALHIYNAHFFEQSNQARFLNLVMVLEILSPQSLKHPIAQTFIETWATNLKEKIQQLESDSDEYHALESLLKEISFRKQASLRSQIRSLVLETLTTTKNPHAKNYAKQAVELYDIRSSLIHNGFVESKTLEKALIGANEVVLLVLKAKLALSA